MLNNKGKRVKINKIDHLYTYTHIYTEEQQQLPTSNYMELWQDIFLQPVTGQQLIFKTSSFHYTFHVSFSISQTFSQPEFFM